MPAASAAHRDLGWDWNSVLGRLRVDMNPRNYEMWLEGSRAVRLDGELLIVEARSAFMCDWLNERMVVVVEKAVAKIFERELRVRFVAKGWDSGLSERPGGSPDGGPDGCAGNGAAARRLIGSLNSQYTFERYLPAEGNRLALETCSALLDPEEFCFNPIVVYGSPGMGKTHLLHAVAGRAAAQGWNVACLSAEHFTNRYQQALREHAVPAFQAELRGVRLLIIDDLQYLAGKKGTQDELVHTIDAVTTSGGYVVIASEVHPLTMDLPDRLSSRISCGMSAPVGPFVAEERRAYIERVAREARIALPGWAIDRIAGCESPSVRLLNGAVTTAIGLQRTGGLEMRALDAALVWMTANAASPRALDDRATLALIARHFEVTFEDLVGASRTRAVGDARAVAAVVLKNRGKSLSEVGSLLGGRDKTTVKAICTRGQGILAKDAALRMALAG